MCKQTVTLNALKTKLKPNFILLLIHYSMETPPIVKVLQNTHHGIIR